MAERQKVAAEQNTATEHRNVLQSNDIEASRNPLPWNDTSSFLASDTDTIFSYVEV